MNQYLATQYDVFMSLVRLGIGHSSGLVKGPVDWNIVFALAMHHKLVAVAFDGLDVLEKQGTQPDDGPATELKDKWISQTIGCEIRYNRCCDTLSEMAAFFRIHGIKMMVLKGYSLSLDWPVPNHRTSGDIDIWLFGRQKEGDDLVIKEKGLTVDNSHHHHTTFLWGKMLIENHFDFINVHNHRSHQSLEKILKELAQDDSCSTEINGERVFLASPKLAALFLLKHTMLHFVSYDFSFRQILDWAFFAQKHGKELDWDWLLAVLEEQGMLPLFHIFNAICIEDFGFDTSIFPHVEADPLLKERVRHEIYYPSFKGGEPNGKFFYRVCYKTKRWISGIWKQKLCYKESIWSSFWSGIWSHLMKPASI